MHLKLLIGIILIQILDANDANDDDPEFCRCYCCPSEINPYKDKAESCDPKNPPLIGSIAIVKGSGTLSCTALTCNGYFSIECPPVGMKSSKGAAVKVGCTSCADGPFGNGSLSKDQPGIENALKDYLDKGNGLQGGSVTEYLSASCYIFQIIWIVFV